MCFSGPSPAFVKKKNQENKGTAILPLISWCKLWQHKSSELSEWLSARCERLEERSDKDWFVWNTLRPCSPVISKRFLFSRSQDLSAGSFLSLFLQAPDLSIEGTLTSLPLPQVTQVRTQSSRSPRCWDPPGPIMSHFIGVRLSFNSP